MGASSFPSRVFPGKRLPGRTGGDKVKITNLRVLKVIPKINLSFVKCCEKFSEYRQVRYL